MPAANLTATPPTSPARFPSAAVFRRPARCLRDRARGTNRRHRGDPSRRLVHGLPRRRRPRAGAGHDRSRPAQGTADGVIDSGDYKRFYMHRTGHWLGLDVHDAGEYKEDAVGGDWVKLAPGMTLTIEPGLYIRPATDIPQALHGIGIRIEDDALVTATGCEVYTDAPKTVAEIEEVMHRD